MLCRYAATPSVALREEIVRRLMPLARSLAMRFSGGTEPIDDLVQVANLGLLKAVDRFDPSRSSSFGAFAVPTILGELRRHIRDGVWNLRLPRVLQEVTMKIETAVDQLKAELGRSPTTAEIAAHLGTSSKQVLEGMAATHARRTLSLDAPERAGADAQPTIAIIGCEEPGYERVEIRFACADAGLDDRERRVLRLSAAGQLTQSEIGELVGLSQMQISRIIRRALWKLLAAVRGEHVAGPVPAAVISRKRAAGRVVQNA